MNLIPVKKEKRIKNGKEIEVFIVPAMCITHSDGKERKIPHPEGQDIVIYSSLEEAKQFISLAGFSYSMLNSENKNNIKNIDYINDLNLIIYPLIELLNDKSIDVVASAAFALGETASPAAIPYLIKLLGKDDNNIRKSSIEALAKIGNPAVSSIIQILDDLNWVVRNSAAQCILEMSEYKNINLLSSINPLINALSDNNSIVRCTAATALGKVYKSIKKLGESPNSTYSKR